MNVNNFNNFVLYCKNIQPQSQEDIGNFFEAVRGFPYDQELLLQAFLFLNIQQFFPDCTELLLFEKSPIGNYTNLGKCDFVYLTAQGHLRLIETKFIDTKATGATEITRRNKHKNKVFEQVISLKSKFSEYWKLPIEQLECSVFTTDLQIVDRGYAFDVVTKSIPIYTLEQWQQKYKRGA
jgi:hypothetical protein